MNCHDHTPSALASYGQITRISTWPNPTLTGDEDDAEAMQVVEGQIYPVVAEAPAATSLAVSRPRRIIPVAACAVPAPSPGLLLDPAPAPEVAIRMPPVELEEALRIIRSHGLTVSNRSGEEAAMRRCLATALQGPGSKSTDQHYATLHAPNISLATLQGMLQHKHWVQHEFMQAGDTPEDQAGMLPGAVRFTTNSSKALAHLFSLEQTRKWGLGASKLFLPARATEAAMIIFGSPPASLTHRVRADYSTVIEGTFKISTLTDVTLPRCLPHRYHSSHPATRNPILPTPHRVCCRVTR